jgi:hypothetical protein
VAATTAAIDFPDPEPQPRLTAFFFLLDRFDGSSNLVFFVL